MALTAMPVATRITSPGSAVHLDQVYQVWSAHVSRRLQPQIEQQVQVPRNNAQNSDGGQLLRPPSTCTARVQIQVGSLSTAVLATSGSLRVNLQLLRFVRRAAAVLCIPHPGYACVRERHAASNRNNVTNKRQLSMQALTSGYKHPDVPELARSERAGASRPGAINMRYIDFDNWVHA